MKNAIIGLLTGVLLVGGVVWYLSQQNQILKQKEIIVVTPTIPQATITTTILFEPTVQSVETDIQTAVAKALATKNNWQKWDNLAVTVTSNDGVYAKGGVKEKDVEVGGGYWFAKKVGNEWIIVADGNGVILCSSVEKFPDYPVALIPECFDEATNTTKKR